jgi:plasmid stabilization system protein ParE
MRILESAQAVADSDHISASMYSAKAGIQFLNELRKTYDYIAQTPTIGSLNEELEGSRHIGLRQCTVKRFRNYIVFYRIRRDAIVIERVLDGRRNYLQLFFT